jgi:hypothetical protein
MTRNPWFKRRQTQCPPQLSHQPRVEELEDRCVPSLLPGHEFQLAVPYTTPAAAASPDGRTALVAVLGLGGGTLDRVDTSGSLHELLQLTGFQTIYAYLRPADSGQLVGTNGVPAIFVTAGSYSYVTAGNGTYFSSIAGIFNAVNTPASVYAYAANPADQVWHYDTAAMDSFVAAGNAYSYMSGTDNGHAFFNEAVDFQVTYAIATHVQSYPYLIDSPGNDVFVGYAPYSYLSGSDNAGSLFNVAEGFVLVYAESFVGGTDYAYNYSPSHNILNSRWILLT